jgi:hypothetical protein
MRTLERHTLYILGLTLSLFTLSCQSGNSIGSSLGSSTNGSSGVAQNRTTVIQATATDTVTITKVQFYANSQLICTVISAPYNCSWAVPPGAGITYKLQTKAFDVQGKEGDSAFVTVTSQ